MAEKVAGIDGNHHIWHAKHRQTCTQMCWFSALPCDIPISNAIGTQISGENSLGNFVVHCVTTHVVHTVLVPFSLCGIIRITKWCCIESKFAQRALIIAQVCTAPFGLSQQEVVEPSSLSLSLSILSASALSSPFPLPTWDMLGKDWLRKQWTENKTQS